MISVVITAYNVEKYIEQAINSCLNLTYKDIEIIVVNDKSTDKTLSVINKIAANNSKIVVINNENNVGAGMSRKIGISHAKGDYVMLIDGDDYIEGTEHIEHLVDAAIKYDADIVGGGIKILHEDGSSDITLYGDNIFTGMDKIARSWKNRTVFLNNRIIRRSMYDIVPYSERRYIEDTPVIIPLLWYANKVVTINESGYVYRMREQSLTHENNILQDVIYKGLCWYDLNEFFEKNDPEVFKVIEIKEFISNIISTLNNMIINEEAIKPYEKEWGEFSRKLINSILITNINFKIAK